MLKDKYKKELKLLEEGLPPSLDAGIFGSPYACEDAKLVLLACPWEATASFGLGTSLGPQNILAASHQLDLEHPVFGSVYKKGLAMDLSLHDEIFKLNCEASRFVEKIRTQKFLAGEDKASLIKKVNQYSEKVNQLVYERAKYYLNSKKKVCLVGGDHSSSYGLVKALSEVSNQAYSILHIDAHFDLRSAYEGFKYSHASIMFNLTSSFENLKTISHVAIRDYSKEEIEWAKINHQRSKVYLDNSLQRRLLKGESFASIAREIIASLGPRVYVSFDIDGLKPELCPQTGTPVPGGLDYAQVSFLFEELQKSGKEIIGADLLEVAGGEKTDWDGNVGARLLYQLCGLLTGSSSNI